MDTIEQKGKTVEEAVELALEKLDITREEAEIKVLEKGTKALLGIFGGKDARVEVKIKVDPIQVGLNFLKNVLKNIDINAEVEVLEERTNKEQVVYNIISEDLGIIIGHRGETLDALQYLTSLTINRVITSYYRVIIDAEGYRERRRKTLERLGKKLARKAVETGRKVVLEPMPPHERRIIHITLKKDDRVITYSEGREPYRKVMIETGDNEG